MQLFKVIQEDEVSDNIGSKPEMVGQSLGLEVKVPIA